MKLVRFFQGLVLSSVGGLICQTAFAIAPICVDPGHTATSLTSALQTWVHSGAGTTTIKVVAGTFPISISLQQLNDPSGSLVLLGGYKPNTGCDEGQRNIMTQSTILDGGGAGAFALQPGAPVTIDGLTFSNFYGGNTMLSGEPVFGVVVFTVQSAVTMTRFIANHDETVYVFNNNNNANAFSILLQNCLVYNQPVNATDASLHVAAEDGPATISNCTISDNTGNGNLSVANGLEMETYGDGQISVYNTIAFDNGIYDFFTGDVSNPPNVYFSMYATGTGFNASATNIAGPTTDDPQFVSFGNDFHLGQQSTAINAGDPNLTYPSAETDLDGKTRVVGGRIDMGAYESSYVPNQFVVTSTLDNGNIGTLHWAINQANANPTPPSTITFNLGAASGCPYTIALASALPDIGAPVFIDGRTQPGWVANSAIGAFNGTLCVGIAAGGTGTNYAFHTAAASTSSQLVALGMMFSGFNQAAIKLEGGSGHNIGDNWFGGPSLAANHYGVQVLGNAAGAQIGGADAAFANVFDNSSVAGIYLNSSAGGNLVQNNIVGIAPDGMTAEGNGTDIFISGSPNNIVRSNYIGYSIFDTSAAVVLYGAGTSGNLVQQNNIGWDFYGNLPDAGAGVFVTNGASNNFVGNEFAGAGFGNSIRNSDGPGVWIGFTAGTGNYVIGNDIVSNGGPTADNGLAIDLGGSGPDANTFQGAQNYPVLRNSFAMPNNQMIKGTLDAAPNSLYRIDFYHLNSVPLGSSGRGDAGLFSGFSAVTTDANGHCSFLLTLPQVEVAGWLSGSATELFGNTSEISNAVPDQNDGIFVNGFGQANGCQ